MIRGMVQDEAVEFLQITKRWDGKRATTLRHVASLVRRGLTLTACLFISIIERDFRWASFVRTAFRQVHDRFDWLSKVATKVITAKTDIGTAGAVTCVPRISAESCRRWLIVPFRADACRSGE